MTQPAEQAARGDLARELLDIHVKWVGRDPKNRDWLEMADFILAREQAARREERRRFAPMTSADEPRRGKEDHPLTVKHMVVYRNGIVICTAADELWFGEPGYDVHEPWTWRRM